MESYINPTDTGFSEYAVSSYQPNGNSPYNTESYANVIDLNPNGETTYETASIPVETYQVNEPTSYVESVNEFNTYDVSNDVNVDYGTTNFVDNQVISETNTYENNVSEYPVTNIGYDTTNVIETNNYVDTTNIIDTNNYVDTTNVIETNNYVDTTNIIDTNNYVDTTNIIETNNYVDTNNIIETTPYQESYQTSDFIDTTIPSETYSTQTAPVEYVASNYDVTSSTPISDFYSASPVNVESTNFIPEVRNSFETYNTDIVPYQTSSYNQGSTNYYDSTSTNFDTNAYNTTSSAYELNSVPVEISPSLTGNDDTELIPVEEIEYIPIKKQKYIRRKKVPVKKTVVIPKKVVVPLPVKKTIIVPKKKQVVVPTKQIIKIPKVKYVPSPTPVLSMPKPQPVYPRAKSVVSKHVKPLNYQPKIYRRKI